MIGRRRAREEADVAERERAKRLRERVEAAARKATENERLMDGIADLIRNRGASDA